MEPDRKENSIESMPSSNGITQRVISNVSWSVVSQVGGKGMFFLVTIYLARVLGVNNYGHFSFAQSVVLYFWLAVDLGVNMYGARAIAKDKGNASKVVNPLLSLRVFSGLSVFIIFIILVHFFNEDRVQRFLFTGCGFYLLARSVNVEWAMRGFEKFKYIAFANSSTFLIMLLSMFWAVKDSDAVVKASFLWSFCYLLGSVILLLLLYGRMGLRFEPVFDIKAWLLHLRESFHFTLSGGLLTLYQHLPILFLGIFASAYEVGIFSAPYRLIMSIVFVLAILPFSLYPVFSDLHSAGKESFRKLHNGYKLVSLGVGLGILIVGTFFARDMILLLFGSSYSASASFFRVMLVYVFLYCIRVPYGIAIVAAGLQRYFTLASASGVLFFIILFTTFRKIVGFSYLSSVSYSLVITELGVAIILILIWKRKSEMSWRTS